LAGKNVTEMTFLCQVGRKTLTEYSVKCVFTLLGASVFGRLDNVGSSFWILLLHTFAIHNIAYCHLRGLAVSVSRPAKMAEVIEMPFGMWTREAK